MPFGVDGICARLNHELILPLVYLVAANAIVTVGVAAVAGFAQVEHSQWQTVQKDVCRLCGLAVQVDAARLQQLLNHGIPDTSVLVLSAVSYQ